MVGTGLAVDATRTFRRFPKGPFNKELLMQDALVGRGTYLSRGCKIDDEMRAF